MDFIDLRQHLNTTKGKFNVKKIYDKSGYSPIHYAAYKNIKKACEIIIEFILQDDKDQSGQIMGGSGETVNQQVNLSQLREKKKTSLKIFLNERSRGDDGFTALHFAAFHGNMDLIRLLVNNGANIYEVNR